MSDQIDFGPSASELASYEQTAWLNKQPHADCGGCQELLRQIAALTAERDRLLADCENLRRFREDMKHKAPLYLGSRHDDRDSPWIMTACGSGLIVDWIIPRINALCSTSALTPPGATP